MPLVTFYFELHQPFRLHPDTSKFLWDDTNREIFKKVAEKNYLPATWMFTNLVAAHPTFKICFSMSGVFLEQAELYQPEVITALRELLDAGKDHNQVEFLEETYYHSLSGLFHDPDKREFREQVSLHRRKMVQLFGVKPTSFRNTELMYNNEVAAVVADMGFKSILCEQRDDMYTPKNGLPISPNAIFRANEYGGKKHNLIVLARNRNLSDDIAFRFPHAPISPHEYASHIAKVDGEAVVLGYDYEHIGEHIWEDKGIFDFWQSLPAALSRFQSIRVANPSEIADMFKDTTCPLIDIHPLSTSSWADIERNTCGWLGTQTQYTLFRELEDMESAARAAGDSLLNRWRMLTTSDHLYYLHEGKGADRAVHDYFSPYGSLSTATFLMTRNLDKLNYSIKNFNVHKGIETTPVIIITPEIDRLPSEGMGQFAQFVSGKSGGMGQVVSAICKGLAKRNIAAHLITLNLQRRFREEAKMSDTEWIQNRHKLNPERIHLVTSSVFEDYYSAYDGNPIETAAEFQKSTVNTYIKEIRSKYNGRGIIHSHDWMAGGIISSYANKRGIGLLHTVHNTHSANIPLSMLHGVNIGKFRDNCFMAWDFGQECIDAQATAIKNATLISYVGKTFLQEVVNDYFMDRPFIPWPVRMETKVKYHAGTALTVYNGISPDEYPENQPENPDPEQPGLAKKFGSDSDVIAAKKLNLIKFQKRMGLNIDPDAILLLWPSRLDPTQKGIELLEDIALRFVIENGDVQIAVVGNPVGQDRSHAEILGRIACASGGKIAFRSYSEDLCKLGYAAASDAFGASLYEPFGQIDVMGNLYGATATNRATGGYSDKIVLLSLKARGAPEDIGNGVLFNNYDSSGLWYGLYHTIIHHRFFRKNPDIWQKQVQRIMKEARSRWDLDKMVAGYLALYEKINCGVPLV